MGAQSSGPAGMQSKGRGDQVFVRQATGLVREASVVDATIFNLIWASLPLGIALIFLYGPAFYTTASLPWSVILAAVIALPIAATYAILASAMPRSGGDYVWVTRNLHPALGFMSNLTFNFWITYFIGIYATLLGSWGLSSVFRLLAADTGNTAFLSPADFFVTKLGVIVLGAALVLLSGLLFVFGRGIETFLRFQRWGFLLWVVGGILVAGIVMLFTSHDTFVSNFNSYVKALGGPANAYDAAVKAGGYSATASTFGGSLLGVTLPYYALGFLFQSAYFGGEIKRGRGVHMVSIVGAVLITTAILLFFVLIFIDRVGMPFLAAVGGAAPSSYGMSFAPLYAELAAISSGNIVFGLLITVGFTVGFIVWVPQTIVLISRSIFAWSFDRLVPEKLAEVDSRTHSPVIATLVIMVAGLIAVIILALNPTLTAIVGLLGLTVTYIMVSLAAILFPYRQPDAFASSPFNGRLAGIPIVSVIGALSLVTSVVVAGILLTDQNSGTSWVVNRNTVIMVAAVVVAGPILYYVLRAIQSSRGVNVGLAYKEIPPD
jgi:basic amino acid/polyamine antiporter, APA family